MQIVSNRNIWITFLFLHKTDVVVLIRNALSHWDKKNMYFFVFLIYRK